MSPFTTPQLRPSLILMGLRASGKSTLGPLLARSFDVPFVDLDDRTARALGADAPGPALERHGLSAFRAAEARMLHECLSRQQPIVLALGGGTPTAPGASELLRTTTRQRSAMLVYLRVQPPLLSARLRASQASGTARPSLTGQPADLEVPTLFAQRDPLYRELADRVLDLDALDQTQAHDLIVREWRSWLAGQ